MEDLSDIAAKYEDLGAGERFRFDRMGARGKLVYRVERDLVLEWTAEGDAVLDAGGGGGKFSVPLAAAGRDVTLVDLAARQCEIAAAEAADHDLADEMAVARGDIRSLGLRDDRFDAIVCLGGPLSHAKGDVGEALSEFVRVGRPGCHLLTGVMSRTVHGSDLYAALAREEGDDLVDRLDELAREKRSRERSYDDIGSFHCYSTAEMRDRLEGHGFSVLETRAVNRHDKSKEFLLADAWEDEETREALVEYEKRVSRLPWFQNSGNVVFQVARLG